MLKKLVAFLTAAVVAASAFSLAAGAASVKDYAKEAKNGVACSGTVLGKKGGFNATAYKMTLAKKGTLTIDFVFEFENPQFFFLSSDLKYYNPSEVKMTSGTHIGHENGHFGDLSDGEGSYTKLKHNANTRTAGTATFNNLPAGTYYFRISYKAGSRLRDGKYTLTFSYPAKEEKKKDPVVTDFTITIDKGDKIKLGAVVDPADSKVEWVSSNPKAATVSASGKVTAKRKGSTLVTAKSGKSKKTIRVIVED